MKTPESSIHVTPSTTGRSGNRYVPGVRGARTLKVNVAVWPGATLLSTVVASRFADSQPSFIPRSAKAAVSPLRPRFACFPAMPFCHVAVPVFWNLTVSDVDAPGGREGHALSLTKAEWKVCVGAGTDVPPAPAVVKSHSFVAITPFTLMSKRTWYVVPAARG